MRAVLVALVLSLSACVSGDAPDPAASPATPPEVEPVILAEAIPETMLGRARQSFDQSKDGALGAEIERVEAGYGEVTVSVTDFKTAEMTTMMGHGWAFASGVEQIVGHPGARKTTGGSSMVQIVVQGRFLIEATAPTDGDALDALGAVDLTKLG